MFFDNFDNHDDKKLIERLMNDFIFSQKQLEKNVFSVFGNEDPIYRMSCCISIANTYTKIKYAQKNIYSSNIQVASAAEDKMKEFDLTKEDLSSALLEDEAIFEYSIIHEKLVVPSAITEYTKQSKELLDHISVNQDGPLASALKYCCDCQSTLSQEISLKRRLD